MSSSSSEVPRPLPNTYWVIPGEFLAGEYPGALSEEDARAKLGRLLDAGIRVFVDLTEPGELTPYAPLLSEISQVRGLETEHHRFAIPDACLPHSTQQVHEVLSVIESALTRRLPLFLHCWGGIGRTGTLVGCFLVERGQTGDGALREIAERWLVMEKRHRQPRAPDTDEQHDFVRLWKPGQR